MIREQEKEKEYDPDCPEGHVPMTDEERLESLELAKKSNI